MSGEKKRVGLIGCGSWGKYILRDLISLGCEVPVVARSPGSVERANAGGAVTTVGDIRSLGQCDGYVVATPTDTHFEVIREIFDTFPGTPVYVEKPLTNDASQIVELASGADWLFTMDKWRYHQGVLRLARLVADKTYGEVVAVKMRRFSWGSLHEDSNTVWHLLPHDLSITLELLGELPAPVLARLDRTGGEIRGMTAVLGHKPWVQLEVSDRFERHHREIRIFFEHAVVVLGDAYADHLTVLATDETDASDAVAVDSIAFPTNMPLFDELKAFIGYLSGGSPPKSSFRDASQVVDTIASLLVMAP